MSKLEIIALLCVTLSFTFMCIVFTIYFKKISTTVVEEIKSGAKDKEIIDEDAYNNLPKVKRRKHIMNTIKSLGFYGILIVIIPVFVFSIINKLQGKVTNFNDKGLLAIASGSMSYIHKDNSKLVELNCNNQFNTFDVIIINEVNSEDDLDLYDVIAFENEKGQIIVHRIVAINYNEFGNEIYTTRGDANNKDDVFKSTIEDVKGKYIDQRIGYVGAVILFFQSYIGLVTIIAIAYCWILVSRSIGKVKIASEERLNEISGIEKLDNKKMKESE